MLAYIHIGCEKTGTTSVQAFLETNASAIRQAGWALPEAGWFPNTTRLALSCMDRDKSDGHTDRLDRRDRRHGRGDWREAVWTAVADELAAGSPRPERLVVSSEYFQARLDDGEEVARLRRRFERIGVTEFRIVCPIDNRPPPPPIELPLMSVSVPVTLPPVIVASLTKSVFAGAESAN